MNSSAGGSKVPRYTLLCPGPVNVEKRVAEAFSSCALSHREDNFTALLRQVQSALLSVANLHNSQEYTALVMTGSGTAANEAVLSSVVPADRAVIVLSNGEFGERLAQTSALYHRTETIQSPWGEDLDLDQLEKQLASKNPGLVAMVYHETSTGLLNPVQEVGNLCRRYGVNLFVDAVSSFSADDLPIESAGVTFLSTSSGKAIASYPGLSFVLGKHQHFSELENYPVKNSYLNIYKYYQFSEQFGQTPHTPSIPLIMATKEALQSILSEGLSCRYERLAALAAQVRQQLELRQLYLPSPKKQSVVLTNALLPKKMTFSDLQNQLHQYGFSIYNTKGPLREHYFQIGNIGDICKSDIDRFFVALDDCLANGCQQP